VTLIIIEEEKEEGVLRKKKKMSNNIWLRDLKHVKFISIKETPELRRRQKKEKEREKERLQKAAKVEAESIAASQVFGNICANKSRRTAFSAVKGSE